jgi:hypothetical protein
MKTIICVDGGGVKGIAASVALASMELSLGKKLHEATDLFIGSSVGSILSSLYAHGELSGLQIHNTFLETLPKVFKRRMRMINTPKYDRSPVRKAFKVCIGEPRMRDCAAKFISTAVNACDSRTHYFKSAEIKDGNLPLIDVVERSFAAPLFFGGIVDQDASALWLDGGTGADNCPILTAFTEAGRQGWLTSREPIHILSIGCGYSEEDMSWEKAQHSGNLAQIMYFADPADGGLARRQITEEKVNLLRDLQSVLPNFSFQRVDFPLTKEQDAMDKLEYADLYKAHGNNISKRIDLKPFQK